MGVLSLSSGLVADYLNSKNWTTLTVIRKLFTCSGQFVSMCNVTKTRNPLVYEICERYSEIPITA